ncbi:hypothetical protein [Cloacibacterium normanense]|uniref:hypothetical protein n=1 Tax=Cloacibacterium normanense TaxID=237258 RepID=UPI00391B37FE
MMRLKILKLIALFIYFISCGQENKFAPIDYPNSPDVSKMQTYGQIPVSTYSGLANVSVPIYSISEDGLEFPITLNYNTRGIKVNEESSRVGLGWSLGFPGLISRSMNGQNDLQGGHGQVNGKYFNAKAIDGQTLVPDLLGYFAIPTDYIKLGLDTRLWPTDYKLEKYISGNRVKDNTDFQPDDYYYNLPAASGRFIFKRNKTAVLENIQDNLKIEILDSLDIYNQPTRYKMKVTDKIGNSYYFNDIESYYNQGASLFFIDNAWYVSKIVTSNGKEIEFIYDDLDSTPSYNLYDYYGMPISLYNDCNNGISSCGNFPFGEKKVLEGLKSFKSKLIKKIIFPSGYVEFTYDTRQDIYKDKKITSIRIFDNKNKLIKGINLNHDYFIANYTTLFTELGEWQQDQEGYNDRDEYLKKRLKLTSLDYLDSNSNIVNSEKFEYFDNNIPAKNSTAVDIWGYFNGETNNQNLFPNFSITVPEAMGNRKGSFGATEYISWSNSEKTLQISGANRNVIPQFTKMMSLKKIVYPTKGYTEFEYENNTYDPQKSFVNDNNARKISFFQNNNTNGRLYNYAGGLRIKSLLNEDDVNGSYIKTYIYHYTTDDNNDGINELKSYGYLLDRPNLFDLRKVRSTVDNYQDVNGQHGYILIRNMPIYKNDFLGYEYVEEITENIKTKEQIKKKFNYYISPPIVYNVFALGKGFETPRPNFREPENVTMRDAYKNYNVFLFRYYKYDSIESCYYRDYSFDYKPIEVRNDTNPLNGLLKSTINYIYKNNKFSLLSEDEYIYSATQKDLIWGCIYGHALDYINSNPHVNDFTYFNPLPFYNPYTTAIKNTQGYPFFNVYNLIYKVIFPTYNPGPTSIIKKEYSNGTALITKTENTYASDNNVGKGNILSTITTFPDGTKHNFTYQYAHEKGNQYLIDKNIVGISLQKTITKNNIGISSVDTKYPTTQTEANTKTNGLPLPTSIVSYGVQIPGMSSTPNTEIIYDKYDSKGNILQYTTKSGIPLTIIWGYNQTQPIAKIEGAKYDDVKTLQVVLDAITSSNADALDPTKESGLIAALDKLRDESTLKNFQITTYTYDPLIGVTSITPPSGVREIYKYDTANRLEKVVDINGNILKEYKYHYKQ